MDLINKLIPTKIQTVIKVFLIRTFPFNFDRWAPKYPPAKEPTINTNNIFEKYKIISELEELQR